jgi:predicted flap endonuclease-1-like 5' DNA nuclease
MDHSELWIVIILVVLALACLVFWLARGRRSTAVEPARADSVASPSEEVSAATVVELEIDRGPLIAPAPEGPPDDLTRMKGVGPKLVALLHELGVTHFSQIAAWTDVDVAAIDQRLGTFKGRITRDRWVEQARHLAEGDASGFEAKFGKLG